MRSTAIEIRHLTTGYHGRTLASGLDASLRTGELTCLLGPNGAGKSTLLKTLCGFIPPLAGDVLIEGTPLTAIRPHTLARLVSVVLTARPATTGMSVAELVAMGRSPYTGFMGRLRQADRRIVDAAMQQAGIADMAHRTVATLSDGECQKAMIAKALAQQTPVILLDEPTSHLDYPGKAAIMQLLLGIARTDRRAVFMSTHDIHLALQIADRIWLLGPDGSLTIGIPEDIARTSALADTLGSPALQYDPATGAFSVRVPQHKAVSLQGHGPLAALVERALRRKGIGLSTDAPVAVTVSDDTISMRDTICPDIETLLDRLDSEL